jgi:hypothetical protein
MKGSCAIVIPVYTLNLSSIEKAGLLNSVERLSDYDIFFLHKESLDIALFYQLIKLTPSQVNHCRAISVEDCWLESVKSYSKLLFQGWFYQRFQGWDYMLIFQQDAWLFGDGRDLAFWINKGYTYIGAPWTSHLGPDTPDMGVGNGGFSLRHVPSMIRICTSFKTKIVPVFRFRKLAYRMGLFRRYHLFPRSMWPQLFSKRLIVFFKMSLGWHNTLAYFSEIVGTQEDHLISLFSPLVFPWMRIPPMAEAAAFSVETNPRETCSYYQVSRPFGCHAWEMYDREFWIKAYPEEFRAALGVEDASTHGS